ncbi:hypothetical protein A0J61_05590 [Choanephora cucurbitarum]|uniref:Uncharacterized protein n=1 Tax=Choanephora cucurbitarum TaxID=101091 RepID=A0A1C7NB69_9FUNG|nr:hypothetical protein A0J61_05590 [Choanephora cucurbitarum]
MKLLRLSILLVAPAVFCATTPKTEIDAITNAIIDQFLNQHDLELLLKAAEREASEAIIQHAEALQMQNTPRDFSELIEKLSSETSFKAAQLSLPLSGLLGGLTGIISNITIQITPSSPLASPSTSPLPAILSNPVVLRIDAGSFNNVNQVQHVVREVLQRAVSSDPIVMSAMNSPSQESIANAISSIILSVSENMAAAA